jgi:hypothetical protein
VFAAQHLTGLSQLDVRLELVESLEEIAVDGFAGFRPLDQDAQIVGAPLEGLTRGQLFVETTAALKELLRFGGILPEVGMCDAAFDLVEFRAMARFVKDSSASRLPASRDPDTAVPVLPARTPRNAPFHVMPELKLGPTYITTIIGPSFSLGGISKF